MSSLSIGIVGLPNVGKSTLFNALLKKQVALAANYPFATIEPNIGVVEVPDERLLPLAELTRASEKLAHLPPLKYALVEFVDIAGLVKGASQGEGLGNQFLANIRETQVVCHVLRAFADQVVLREGSVTPTEDLAIVRTELQLADLATVSKQKPPKGAGSKEELKRWQIIEQFRRTLEQGQNILQGSDLSSLSAEEQQVSKELALLTAKPEIFALNVAEDDLASAVELKKEWAGRLRVQEKQIVIISAKIESELASLSSADQQLYMSELGLEQSGLERLARVAYATLGLQSFFTTGQIETKAWTIRRGNSAQQAAGVIHSDFAQKFISAKVVGYQDFMQSGGWQAAKEAGKLRQEGRDYLMQDGDIVEFMVGK